MTLSPVQDCVSRSTTSWRVHNLDHANKVAEFAAVARAALPIVESDFDLDWLTAASGAVSRLHVMVDYDGVRLVGLAPFRRNKVRINVSVGPLSLYNRSIERFSMAHEPLSVRAEPKEAISDCLIALSADLPADGAVYFEAVPAESRLGRILARPPADFLARYFILPWGSPYEHYKIKWEGTIDGYLNSLTSKNRSNMKRPIRRIDGMKNLRARVRRFSQPCDVDAFLSDGLKVSEKTYQKRHLGAGLTRGGGSEAMMRFAAERGGLLAHVLYVNDEPVAFQYALVYAGIFYGVEMGYDPAFADLQPGNLLFFKMLEDIDNERDPIRLIDLLTYDNTFKHRSSNMRIPVQNYYLFPRSATGRVMFAPIWATTKVRSLAMLVSDWLHLSERIRRWSDTRGKAPKA